MKKNIITLILTGTVIFSICSCGNKESEHTTEIPTETFPVIESTQEIDNQQAETSTKVNEETSAATAETEEDTFSFADFDNLEFSFSSGAGGWQTTMSIRKDGSFSGEYFDGDMGVTGDDYPNGTMYQCDFKGQFTQPVKVNDYTYSMQIKELDFAREAGTDEIKDGIHYCYTDAYGLDNAKDILIYLPGTPLSELPEEFRSWIGYYDLSATTDTELPFYALNNEAQQYGFTSYDIIENLKEYLSYIEDDAAWLENSLENDPTLTQSDLNQTSKDLYNDWDWALNHVWTVLERTMDKEAFASLVIEEREWITQKEQAVKEAGAKVEGGSMQPMVMNLKAAELTKERVYELMKLLD